VYHENAENQKVCENLVHEISMLESELLNAKNAETMDKTESLTELSAKVTKDEDTIKHLSHEIEKWSEILQEKKSSNVAREKKLVDLKSLRNSKEAAAAEMLRASRNKDPQFEELCKWYTEVNSLLYKLNGIHQVRNISNAEFEIEYEYESQVVATLSLKVNPDADAQFKRLVNAKVIFGLVYMID